MAVSQMGRATSVSPADKAHARPDTIAPPVSLSAFEMRGERPAPAIGADGAEILSEAGLSDEEVKSILG